MAVQKYAQGEEILHQNNLGESVYFLHQCSDVEFTMM
jgi:hypothetical protein